MPATNDSDIVFGQAGVASSTPNVATAQAVGTGIGGMSEHIAAGDQQDAAQARALANLIDKNRDVHMDDARRAQEIGLADRLAAFGEGTQDPRVERGLAGPCDGRLIGVGQRYSAKTAAATTEVHSPSRSPS